MNATKPLIWIATAALSLAVLSGCASATPDAAGADETAAAADTSNPNGEAHDTLTQEELDAMSTAQEMIQNAPLSVVLPLAQHSVGGRTLEIVDTKGAQVQQDAENYLVSSVVNDGGKRTINASRLVWEESNQLEDFSRSVQEFTPGATLTVTDTSGATVDPFALNYVVLDFTNDGITTTALVEPNREYTKGQ